MNWQREEYIITTDKTKLNAHYIHHYLSTQSYWAANIPFETVQKSIEGSLCFGVFHDKQQVGFARMITDYATFGYLADVFIDETHRGKGLAKWLMEIIMAHPELQGFRRFMLGTRDAHKLYEKFGFTALTAPERFMQSHFPDRYKQM